MNPNLGELRKKAVAFFKEKNVSEHVLNVDMLLASVLGISRFDIYMDFERPISIKELELFRNYSKRRINGEPLQYILGYQDFFGLNFVVTPSVFIPRPETELLVEIALKTLVNPERLIDAGTGCGAIAVTMAKKFPAAHIAAIDISKDAISVAKKNADANHVTNIQFIEIDFLKESLSHVFSNIDAIISNPPYIPFAERSTLQKEIRDYEPSIALFSETGLEFYERLASEAKLALRPDGFLFFEIHSEKEKEVRNILVSNGYVETKIYRDMNNLPRVFSARKEN